MSTRIILPSAYILISLASVPYARAQGAAFTYQGRLTDNVQTANGAYDLAFTLYDSAGGTNAIAGPVTNSAVLVNDGLFVVTLDLGASSFPGADRWLEIAVRTNGSGGFATLSPRQQLTASPYAITAGNLTGVVAGGAIAGSYSNAVMFSNPGNTFIGSLIGNGTGLTNVNATSLSGLASTNLWQVRGNAGTAAGTDFLGTTDKQPLELKVDNVRALRLELNASGAPNLIGGAPVNFVGPAIAGATISGGGALNYLGVIYSNSVFGYFGTIGGGAGNAIKLGANYGTVAGGSSNTVAGEYASVPGGFQNYAGADFSMAAGHAAKANHAGAFVWADSPSAAGADFGSTGTNQFLIRASGGVGINKNNPTTALDVNGTLKASVFSGDGSALTNLNPSTLSAGTAAINISGSAASAISATNFSGLLAGDVTGTQAATVVAGIRGTSVAASTPAANQHLRYNGTNWAPGAVALGTDVSGILSVINGGTGATSATQAVVNLGAASLAASNTFTGVNSFTNAINDFIGSFVGDGSGVTSVNAATIGGLASSNFWQLSGNSGTAPSLNFLGTTDGQPLVLRASGGVGINTSNPGGKALAINGQAAISATNTLEFGADVAGKNINAGKIGYQTFTPGALDIVGAGTNATSRKIKFWSESGATFSGTGTNALVVLNNSVDERTSMSFTAPFSTWQVGQNKPPDAPNALDSFFIYQQTIGATRLLITSDGKVGIGTNSPIHPLDMASGAFCSAGGVWTSVSDRNAKEDFKPIQSRDVLAKVAELPITQWKYKTEPASVRHLGPMAQDFHAAFGLGDSDKAIGSVDADGVALAAIQGLSAVVKEKDAEIGALKAKTEELEKRLEALEAATPKYRAPNTKLQ